MVCNILREYAAEYLTRILCVTGRKASLRSPGQATVVCSYRAKQPAERPQSARIFGLLDAYRSPSTFNFLYFCTYEFVYNVCILQPHSPVYMVLLIGKNTCVISILGPATSYVCSLYQTVFSIDSIKSYLCMYELVYTSV